MGYLGQDGGSYKQRRNRRCERRSPCFPRIPHDKGLDGLLHSFTEVLLVGLLDPRPPQDHSEFEKENVDAVNSIASAQPPSPHTGSLLILATKNSRLLSRIQGGHCGFMQQISFSNIANRAAALDYPFFYSGFGWVFA